MTDKITPEYHAETRRICEAAQFANSEQYRVRLCDEEVGLLCHARTALPRYLDAYEGQQAEIERLRDALKPFAALADNLAWIKRRGRMTEHDCPHCVSSDIATGWAMGYNQAIDDLAGKEDGDAE
jgi:hypothetical protein